METTSNTSNFKNAFRPSTGGGARLRLRTGYHKATLTEDVKLASGPRKDGGEWSRIDLKLSVTGPRFANANNEATVLERYSMCAPDPFRMKDGKRAKDKNGNAQPNLRNLTTLLTALGGPVSTEEEPLACLVGIDGLVEPAGVDYDGFVAISDSAQFVTWMTDNWDEIVRYVFDMCAVLGKAGTEVVVKYLSGDGTNKFVTKANGKKVYDNPEIPELQSISRFEKLKDQIPGTTWDRTEYQRAMSDASADANQQDPAAAGGSSGVKPGGTPKPRPAAGQFKRPGSE